MAVEKYSIGGVVTDNDSYNSLQDISCNRTLIALQLTAEESTTCAVVQGLTSIENVFDHYNPSITINLRTIDSQTVVQKILFRTMKDFSIDGITAQSVILRELAFSLEIYKEIVLIITKNSSLKSIIGNPARKKELVDILLILLKELEQKDVNENLAYNLIDNPFKEELASALAAIESGTGEFKADLTKLSDDVKFEFLETFIDGIQYLDPYKRAARTIFLEDPARKEERITLKKKLRTWISIFIGFDNIEAMVGFGKTSSQSIQYLLEENLKTAITACNLLERSYRTLALFFKNTGSSKVKNVSIINVGTDPLKDLDNTHLIDYIQSELVNNYDRLDLRNVYSLLVLPGFLGSNKVVNKWAKIACNHKVLLVTDYADFDSPDDVMELFESSNLTGADLYLTNAIMTCNWLLGRKRYEFLGEEDDLYIPPAAALAGKLYSTTLSQVNAGSKFGTITDTENVRFDLRKSEIAQLENIGLIPMVKEYGKVMAFSAKTLFNGDRTSLQVYAVVRLLDYISKVMMDLLNRRAFENFNANTRKDLNGQIVKFLDANTGPGKLMSNFTIRRFEQDPVEKDKIYLDVFIKPYFPTKTMILQLSGQKGDDGNEWFTEYVQDK